MKVILLKKIFPNANVGDVVNVKPGFARNYLIPFKKAVMLNKNNQLYFDDLKQKLDLEWKREYDIAEKKAAALKDVVLTMSARSIDGSRLYGSINTKMVVTRLREETKIILKKSDLQLKTPIVELGYYDIVLLIDSKVEAKLSINVTEKHA